MEDIELFKNLESGTYEDNPNRREAVWKAAFIASLRSHGNITAASMAAGINRDTAYKARERDPEFAAKWADALDQAVELLELTAHNRALVQSDTLMIFLLKAHRPEKYRERYDVNINIKPPKPYSEMTDAELIEFKAKLRDAINRT
jgi:hypothetical protein